VPCANRARQKNEEIPEGYRLKCHPQPSWRTGKKKDQKPSLAWGRERKDEKIIDFKRPGNCRERKRKNVGKNELMSADGYLDRVKRTTVIREKT